MRQYLAENAPPVYDPFCGGGSIPLEAQRLGLEAHASDLNPVAVLITKALIEIPPKFRDMPPVNPEAQALKVSQWKGAQGLAEDVRYYGKWMRDEAEKRIGHLYPKVKINHEGTEGTEATVIAWLWARTVKCPNPACGCEMPLVRSFALSTKKGKETWVEPIVERVNHEGTEDTKDQELRDLRASVVPKIHFEIRSGQGKPPDGTVSRKGAICIACSAPVPLEYVRAEGKAGRMGAKMMAIVAEGDKKRIYSPPDKEYEYFASEIQGVWKPTQLLEYDPRNVWCTTYGLDTFDKLFTPRQLVALNIFSQLVNEARVNALEAAVVTRMIGDNYHDGGLPIEFLGEPIYEGIPLNKGGTCATAYADAIATYLAFAVDKCTDYWSSLCSWHSSGEKMRNTFGRQAIPMVWDYAECNPFSDSTGNWTACVNWVQKVISGLQSFSSSNVAQVDAANLQKSCSSKFLFSTDPPYYDNVSYANLADFFYVWLRQCLGKVYPALFSTMLIPKTQELIADPYRHGSKDEAKDFLRRV